MDQTPNEVEKWLNTDNEFHSSKDGLSNKQLEVEFKALLRSYKKRAIKRGNQEDVQMHLVGMIVEMFDR
jgi:hypothetical protein